MPWLDTLGLAGETAAEVGAAPFGAAAELGALEGAALLTGPFGIGLGLAIAGSTMAARYSRKRKINQGGNRRPAKRYKPHPRPRRANLRTGGFLGMELKFIDTGIASETVTSAWAVLDPALTSLAPIAQGNGMSNRDGIKAIIKSVFIHGQAIWDQDTVMDQPGPMRIVLVQDQQTNGAVLSPGDVMVTGGLGQQISAFRNLQYTQRFKVLKEVWINPPTFQAEGNGTNSKLGGAFVPFVMHVPNLNMKVQYKGTTGAITDITDNSLHLMVCYGGTRPAELQYKVRCRFLA